MESSESDSDSDGSGDKSSESADLSDDHENSDKSQDKKEMNSWQKVILTTLAMFFAVFFLKNLFLKVL